MFWGERSKCAKVCQRGDQVLGNCVGGGDYGITKSTGNAIVHNECTKKRENAESIREILFSVFEFCFPITWPL